MEKAKETEETKPREQKFAAAADVMIEAMVDAVAVCDFEGRIIQANKAWVELLGFKSADEAIGIKWIDYVAKREVPKSLESFKEILEKGILKNLESVIVRLDGSEVPVLLNAILLKGPSGEIAGSIAVIRDITELKKAYVDISERKKAEEALRASEIRNRTLLENLPQKIFLKDRNSVYISCNENYARDLKIKPEEIAGKTDFEFYPKELAEKYRADDKRIMESEEIEDIEEKYIQDGKERFVYTVKAPVRNEQGDVTGILGIFWNITERKRIEEALRESENRYRLLADNVTDVIFITDLNLRFTYVSPSVISMLGYSAEEVVLKRLEEFLAPSSVEVAKKALGEEMGIENNQGKGFFRSRVLELEIISKDGSSKWAEVKTTFLRDSNERPTSILGICRDLTERMEAEAALIQTNERLQYLLSSTSAVIYTSKISGDYGVTYITGNVRQITGYEPREFTENSSFWIEHVHPEDRPWILEELPRIFEQGSHIYEYRFLHKNGTYRWMRDEMRLERDREGKPLETAGIWIDITERKLTEEKIRHAAEEWRTTFDSITDMVSIHDRNFKIIRVNKAYANFLKKRPQEVIGMTCYELFHGSKEHHPYCPHIQTIQTKKPTTAEFFDSYIGVYLEVFCSPIFDEKGEVIATVHIARDITLRKGMEKTQRLTQLGKLVADMAHEVNNPLMVISGRAQLSLMEQIQNEVIKNNLKIIFEECQRARDIIQRLLSFSRPSKGELKEININRSIETVVGVVEHQFKLAGTEIKRNYIEKPLPIIADEKQIQEVVMNLLNNAKDAMSKGGVIEIVTSSEKDFLRIDFKDTGSGISEEDTKRMFEPFFTTKKEGTGLGLSLCYGIVKAHGGDIKIESKLGKGTTVTVLLPVKEVLGNA